MLNRLQVRLIASFLIVIGMTLCIIGVVWLVVLRTRPVPIEGLANQLTATLLDFNFIEEWQTYRQTNQTGVRRLTPEEFAMILQGRVSSEERMIILRGEGIIIYDSAGHYQVGEVLDAQAYQSRFQTPRERLNVQVGTGIFHDKNKKEWVFAAQRFTVRDARDGQLPEQIGPPFMEVLIAAQRPRPTLRYLLDEYGGTFLLPLCQAGGVGIVIALLLSVWVSQSVARPLKAIAHASTEVARGKYHHKVPIAGPTEIQMVAQAFNEMTTQVQLTQQAQNDFLANVAHDLRTPLTSIQGFAQSVEDGISTHPDAIKHAAHVIHEESARMGRLVTELMDIAKIQAGKMQMLRQAVEVDRILEQVGGSLQLKAKQKGVALHVEIPRLYRIAGDGDRLAQAFTNLADNAIKHTNAGGKVWLKAQPHQNGIQVQIQDTGEGIPSEDVPRIFERFYQVDKSRNRGKQGGTGLGLAITYEIIKAHNGKIQVASQVNVGTTFTVWLPAMGGDGSTVIARKS